MHLLSQKIVEYYLWFSMVGILIIVIGLVWSLSFRVPLNTNKPIPWMIQNQTLLFSLYIIFCALLLGCYLAIIFYSPYTINLREPFTFQGIFILSITVLLLSSFFSVQRPNTEIRFYDTHPLIFYTTVGLITLAVLAAAATNIKYYLIEHKSL